MERNENIQKIM